MGVIFWIGDLLVEWEMWSKLRGQRRGDFCKNEGEIEEMEKFGMCEGGSVYEGREDDVKILGCKS